MVLAYAWNFLLTLRAELRQILRTRRQQLTPAERAIASEKIANFVTQLPAVLTSNRIACYLSQECEVETKSIVQWLWLQRKTCYLPVITTAKSKELYFAPYDATTHLIPNRYQILEPDISITPPISASSLEVVLVPLVGFDKKGHRLGMGGGFYDRSFAFLREPNTLHKPLLVGLAFACQEVPELINESWDIPMQVIITENGLFYGQYNLK